MVNNQHDDQSESKYILKKRIIAEKGSFKLIFLNKIFYKEFKMEHDRLPAQHRQIINARKRLIFLLATYHLNAAMLWLKI